MSAAFQTAESLLRQVVTDVARLPEDDLSLVAEFVQKLKQTPRRKKMPRPDVAQIRAEARRLAAQMGDVPRRELAARFVQAIEDLRVEAVERGIAVEAEWRGD